MDASASRWSEHRIAAVATVERPAIECYRGFRAFFYLLANLVEFKILVEFALAKLDKRCALQGQDGSDRV